MRIAGLVKKYVLKIIYMFVMIDILKLFVVLVIIEIIFNMYNIMTDDNKVILHINDDATKNNSNVSVSPDTKHKLESCLGGSTDKRLYVLVVQSLISLGLVIFSLIMLSDKTLDCSKDNLYSNILTLIVAYWIKSPLS